MNLWLLRGASRLTSLPIMADLAYGALGRLLMGTLARFRFALAQWQVVPISRFGGSYFSPDRELKVDVTNVCNARCSFCAYRIVAADPDRAAGAMPVSMFKKVVDEYSRNGGTSIDLTPTVGDPLLDPTLLEKIRYCKEQTGISDVVLTTNAIAFRKRGLHQQIIDAGATTLCISLPGLDIETYKQVYGVDRYPDVIQGISAVLRYNHERGEPARIILRFRNPDKPSKIIQARDFIDHIKPYLSDRVTCNFTVDYDNWGGAITNNDMFGVMRLRAVPPTYKVPCVGLFSLTVRFDGSVRLCGCRLKDTEDDGLVVGNILDNSLEEIGKSNAVHKIIDGFYRGTRPTTCEQCSFYTPITHKWVNRVFGAKSQAVANGMKRPHPSPVPAPIPAQPATPDVLVSPSAAPTAAGLVAVALNGAEPTP